MPETISLYEVMKLTQTVSSPAAFSDAECAALYMQCWRVRPTGMVVEIGCQLGRTSSIIAQVGRSVGYRHIHIDPYTTQPDYLRQWIAMMHLVGHPFTFECMRTDQVDWMQYSEADLLLIDGDHTHAGVLADCEFAKKIVRHGGILCAHDYGHESLPDVWETINTEIQHPAWLQVEIADTLGVWRRL